MQVMDVRRRTPAATSTWPTSRAWRTSSCTSASRRTPPCASGWATERLERAIGVIYRPETELQSHYFSASLPRQFDEWIWFDRSSAVTPIGEAHREELEGLPETFPFGL
jgi:erythromycin esterase-like protein